MEKKCVRCAEWIQLEALGCRYCGADQPAMTKAQMEAELGRTVRAGPGDTEPKPKKKSSNAIGCIVLLIAIIAVAQCAKDTTPPDPKAQAAKAAEEAEKKKSGTRCLSSWDGSSRAMIAAVKVQLRDPDSFEHIETRIAPLNEKGLHPVLMRYRARNGFGGMNVGEAVGTLDADCNAVKVVIGG